MNDQDRIVLDAPDEGSIASGFSAAGATAGPLLDFGARQRSDFENSPRPMRIFDAATLRYLAVNEAAVRLYGYTRAEFAGLTLRDTRHPDEYAEQLATLSRSDGYFMHREPMRHVKKSGEVFMVEVVSQDVLFEGRRARVSLTIDLTERASALALARQREREFETLAEHLPDLVARFDRQGRYVYVNSAVERLTGAPREALLGKTQRQLGMPDAIVTLFEESLADAARTGQSHMLQFAYPGLSGGRLFEAYHVPERDAAGEVRTVLCVARDITEHKQAENALRESNEFLRSVIESSRDCIKVLDLEGRLLSISTGGQRLMEMADASPLLGRCYLDFWGGAERDEAEAALAAACAGDAARFEGYCPTALGNPRWWDEIVTPILGKNGKPEKLLVVSRDVTENKRAEQTLRDSEARLALAVESTGLGMWDWNVRTGEVWRHPRWARILGYEPGEVRPHICMWKEFCHPDDFPESQKRLLAHFEGETASYMADYRMRNKLGSWIWIGCRGKVIEREEDGTPRRMIGYIRDISDRRTMEEALRESQQQFRAVTETAYEAIVSADGSGNIIYLNQSAAKLFGYSVEEAIGEPLTLLMPARFRAAHERGLRRVLEGHPSSMAGKTVEFSGRRKDGSEFPLELSLASWTTGTGVFFTGIMRNISARRHRQSLESALAAIVNNSGDAIVSTDLDGVVRTWNPGAEHLFGYSAEEAVGQSIAILLPPEQRDEEALILERVRRGGRVEASESVRSQKGGARVDVSLTVSPVRDAAGAVVGASAIMRDITRRKRAEQTLREANQFLGSVIESSGDCIKVLDLEGRIEWMSTPGQRLMEVDDVTAVQGRSYSAFWSGNDRESVLSALAGAAAGGASRFEGYCPTAKGTPKWWSGIATPITGDRGTVEKLLVVSRDITESRKAEGALRESEERFRQLAENIREVFWINTPQGDNLVYVSPAYEEIWGRPRESLYRNPRSWVDPIHPDDLPAVREAHVGMSNGRETDVEYRIVRPDGTLRWIRDRSYPMKRGDGTPLNCGIAEDITSRKREEQERLTHAFHQRNALVREVHHRIKNHLQGIAGLLRNKAGDDPGAAPTIEAAVAQLQSVAVVYGLQSELAESGVPLRRMLEAICASAEGLSMVRVARRFPASGGRIRLAETEAVPVAVALNELVFNAIEHGKRRAGSPAIDISLKETGNAAEIRIVNRGRLPARFNYARGIGTGTGLDLVRTLLGPAGNALEYAACDGRVEVTLSLKKPLLAARKPAARRRGPA